MNWINVLILLIIALAGFALIGIWKQYSQRPRDRAPEAFRRHYDRRCTPTVFAYL